LRFYKLQQQYYSADTNHDHNNAPQLYSVTWTTGEEYEAGLLRIRSQLGCQDANTRSQEKKVTNHNPHVSHDIRRNCTDEVRQDLEYREKLNLKEEQLRVLYGTYPQRLNDGQCEEENSTTKILDLEKLIRESKVSNLDEWVLPRRTS
jgi:hypothetical protein